MRWNYTVFSEYPQKRALCFVEIGINHYKLLWFQKEDKWWYDYDTYKPYAESTEHLKWVYLDDILENIDI